MTWQLDDLHHPVCHLTLTAAFVLAISGTAAAQQTVYVGGSGKIPVEVHMEVLDRLAPRAPMRVVLEPPGQALRSAFLFGPLPAAAAAAPVATLRPLAAPEPIPAMPEPAMTAVATPTVSLPPPELEPALEPAPLPPVTAEPLPEPAMPEPLPEPVVAEPLPEPVVAEPVAAPAAMPEPVPEPVATPVPEPEPVIAALTPEAAPTRSETLSIPFAGGSSELPPAAERNLRAIAEQLNASDSLRAQVKAYADDSTGSASTARRLSLSRALAVRSILIEFGVRSTRIDVRALGDRNEGGAPDRVDVLVINR